MMPIGVPRVPYRTPKEGGWQWVDIWNCLVRSQHWSVCTSARSCSHDAGSPRKGHFIIMPSRQHTSNSPAGIHWNTGNTRSHAAAQHYKRLRWNCLQTHIYIDHQLRSRQRAYSTGGDPKGMM